MLALAQAQSPGFYAANERQRSKTLGATVLVASKKGDFFRGIKGGSFLMHASPFGVNFLGKKSRHRREISRVVREVSGEFEIWILDQVIEEHDKFSHDGGESEFGGFFGGAEFCVEGAQYGIETDRGQGGHVEGVAQPPATAIDVTLAGDGAAVIVEGSDAEKSGGLVSRKGAEFWAESQAGGSGEHTYALNLSETSRVSGELPPKKSPFLLATNTVAPSKDDSPRDLSH